MTKRTQHKIFQKTGNAQKDVQSLRFILERGSKFIFEVYRTTVGMKEVQLACLLTRPDREGTLKDASIARFRPATAAAFTWPRPPRGTPFADRGVCLQRELKRPH